jgi:hypothetical protein
VALTQWFIRIAVLAARIGVGQAVWALLSRAFTRQKYHDGTFERCRLCHADTSAIWSDGICQRCANEESRTR